MKFSEKGFTLIEVMIVVLIVALLASIAIPNILRARVNAHDSSAKVALKTISTAFENYAATSSEYPLNVTSLTQGAPAYLQTNYFDGQPHQGFLFTIDNLTTEEYSLTASPANANLGSRSFTISTGGVLVEN